MFSDHQPIAIGGWNYLVNMETRAVVQNDFGGGLLGYLDDSGRVVLSSAEEKLILCTESLDVFSEEGLKVGECVPEELLLSPEVSSEVFVVTPDFIRMAGKDYYYERTDYGYQKRSYTEARPSPLLNMLSALTEEDDGLDEMRENQKNCWGCQTNQLNQLGHVGGCMPEQDYDDGYDY